MINIGGKANQDSSNAATATLQGLSPQLTAMINSFLTTGLPAINSIIQGGGPTGTAGNIVSQLQNFQALSPADIASLSSSAGAAVESAGQTAASTSGGTANPALQMKQLAQTAGEATGRTATQLGQQAGAQKLSALESAGTMSLDALMQSLGLSSTAGQTGVQGSLGSAGAYNTNQANANQAQSSKNQSIGSAFGGIGQLGGSMLGGPIGGSILGGGTFTPDPSTYAGAGVGTV